MPREASFKTRLFFKVTIKKKAFSWFLKVLGHIFATGEIYVSFYLIIKLSPRVVCKKPRTLNNGLVRSWVKLHGSSLLDFRRVPWLTRKPLFFFLFNMLFVMNRCIVVTIVYH